MLSNLILLIVLDQFGEGFKVDSPVNDFQRHAKGADNPEDGIHSHVFPRLKINDRLATASSFFRELLLAIFLGSAQLFEPLAK